MLFQVKVWPVKLKGEENHDEAAALYGRVLASSHTDAVLKLAEELQHPHDFEGGKTTLTPE